MNIPSRIFYLRVRSPAPLGASHAAETDLFFDFLIGLPEKQVRRDGRAEDCHQRRQKRRVKTESRYERRLNHREPIRSSKESRTNVSKQRQHQPFEGASDQTVRTPNLKRQNNQRDRHNQHGDRNRNQQIDCRGDGSNIRARVNRVRNNQSGHGEVEQVSGVMTPQDGGQAHATHHSDAGTGKLHSNH